MLNVYLNREKVPESADIVDDVHLEFISCTLDNSDIENKLINCIEGSKLNNRTSFTDRFGATLPIEYLSSGSKAALLTLHSDKVINLHECGENALDAIIVNCKTGSVLIDGRTIGFATSDFNAEIDVVCRGYHFTNYHSFNKYVEDWYPLDLGVKLEGVEKC